MKRMRGALIGAAVALVALGLGKNLIAKAAVMGGVKVVTGLDARLTRLQVGVLKPVVAMRGFKVLNPSGYPDRVMLDLPELSIDYDLGSFLKGNAHLRHMRLHLAQFTVVKRADGQVNLDSIAALRRKPAAPAAKQAPAGKTPELSIDVLELKIGKVVYKDYTKQPVMVQEFPVGVDQRYEHVNPYTLAGLIVTQSLMKTTVASLTNFDLKGLQGSVNDALKSSATLANQMATKGFIEAQQMGQSAVGATQEMLRSPGQVAGEVGDTGKQAVEAVHDAGKAVKKLFGN